MPIRRRLIPLLLFTLLGLTSAAKAPAAQPSNIFGPHAGKKLTGVSDDGTLKGFQEFTDAVGKHPAVLQTFHPWGNGLGRAFSRWQDARVLPMLHMSTAEDHTRAELITPRAIARGDGDSYLTEINRFFSVNDQRAYIRPLGEPNRCLNPYSAVTCQGRQKGGDHTTFWYRKAFQRIAVIVRGGLNANRLDRKLERLNLPAVQWGDLPRPARVPAAPVSIIWSALPAGSPRVKGNWPGNYWPGKNFVDWAGVDFYSNYPHWKDLNKFMRGKPWRGKPVSLTEWGVAGSDNYPFVRRLFRWMNNRPRVRMVVYYRGFGGLEDRYNPFNYPLSIRVMRNKLKDPRYTAYGYLHARRP